MNTGRYLSRDPAARRAARAGWVALAAPFAFTVLWLIGGALQDRYSHVEQYVIELAAETASSRWLGVAAYLVLAAGFVALAAGLHAALPGRRRDLAPVVLFGLCGLLFAAAGLLPLECAPTLDEACDRRFDAGDVSWQSDAHRYLGYPIDAALLLTPFALAWSLWPRRIARSSIAAGVTGIGWFVLFFALHLAFGGEGNGEAAGLVQRAGLQVIHTWVGLVAIGLLVWSTGRPDRRPTQAEVPEGSLEPLRFLQQEMSGQGEMSYAWWVRVFRLPRRFWYTRHVLYEGSAMWLMHDVLDYEADWLRFDRTMLARPRSAERMHLSADDMPGGGDTVLFPGGLALEPTWFLTPYWGIPWPMRGQGEMLLSGEDGFTGELRYHLLGVVPFARMTFELVRDAGPRDRPADARSALPA